MSFFKFSKSNKTLRGAIGFAGGACLLDYALKRLIPGAEGVDTSTIVGATVAATMPAASEFIKELYGRFSDLWTNHRTSEHFEDADAAARSQESSLNHDLELQVGRTLATLVDRWRSQQPTAIAAAIATLPEMLGAVDDGIPRWVRVAESIALDIESDQLVDIVLARARDETRSKTRGNAWAKLLQELARPSITDKPFADYATLWSRLGDYIEVEFAPQFHIDLKRALERHPEAWAAMQYRIDAVIVDHVIATHEAVTGMSLEVAQMRRDVLDLGQRCARRIGTLLRPIAAIDRQTREIKELLQQATLSLEHFKARPPLELVTVEANDDTPARLHFTARRVPHVGRETELAELKTFLTANGTEHVRWKRFTWWLWSGAGGMGKSRLALELALDADQRFVWDAGFFSRQAHVTFTSIDWKRWRPSRPTLVIFDYAAERPADIAAAMRELHVRDTRGELAKPVRFLLLERDYAGERLISALSVECDQSTAIAVTNSAFGGINKQSWHRELQPLSDESLLDAMHGLFERKHKFYDRSQVLTVLQRVDQQGNRLLPPGNPLFAAVLAEALIAHGLAVVRKDTAEQLLRRVLANERDHWRDAGVDATHLNWLVISTILRRPVDLQEDLPFSLKQHLPSLADMREDVCELLSSYTPRVERNKSAMYPLEPDRLGELLVLDRLAGFSEVVIKQRENAVAASSIARAALRAAWDADSNAVTGFAARAAQDLPRHESAIELAMAPFSARAEPRATGIDAAISHLDRLFAIYQTWGNLDVANACATKSLELERVRASASDTVRSRRDLSISLSNVAQIELALGRHDSAYNLYTESLELIRAVASELGTPQSRRDVSVSLNSVAQIELARGRHDAALKLCTEILEVFRALASELGTPESRRDLSISLENVAQIELALGRHDAAFKLYTESLNLSRALASEFGTPQSRRDVSVSLNHVAQIELERGRHDAAFKLCAEILEVFRALASELGTPESRRDVSVSLDYVAQIELTLGRHDAALKLYTESLELSRALASELETPQSRRDLSVSLNHVAQIELARGRHDAAFGLYTESLDLNRVLASELGTPESRRDVSISLNSVANIELARGRHDAAFNLYTDSLELRRTLASELETPESRRDVSVSLNHVAQIELARGRHDAAFELYTESLELNRALASELGTPESRRDVSISLNNVAQIELARGRRDAAFELHTESLALGRVLASELRTPQSRRDVSVSMNHVAQLELEQGRHDAALTLYTESLSLRRALASELGTPQSRRDVSVSINYVAQIELAQGRHDAAFKLYTESLELRRALESELGTPESLFDLAMSLLFVALLATDKDVAARRLEESRDLMRKVVDAVGELPRYANALAFVEQQIAKRGA